MKKQCRGVTIVEALATMVVFSFVSMGTASMMLHSTAMLAENAAYSTAVAFAQEATEDLRTLAYEDMLSGTESATDQGTVYTVASVVTPDAPMAGMKTIVVMVTWQSKGEARSYGLETVFTEITS